MMNHELYSTKVPKMTLSVRWIVAAFVLWNGAAKTSAAEFLVAGWGIEDVNYGRLQTPQALNNVISLDGAFGGTIALLSNGTVIQWGAWAQSQPTNLNSVLEIDAGFAWVLVRLADGSLQCWGANDSGQISGIPSGNDYIQVAAGNMHGLALKSNGTVVGWGRNDYGQRNIPSGLTNAIAISAHGHNSLALKSDGTVIGWGNSGSGINNVPVGLMGVQKIACGDSFALALKADGSISAWGNNTYGQTNVPAGLSDVEKIFAEGNTAYAIRKNGTAVAWGYKSADYLKLPELPPGYIWHSIRGGWEHMYGLAQQLSAVDFTAQPQSQTVNQGQSVTFSVTATGIGSLSYQWQKDGVDIPGATSSSFNLASAQPWHIGDYTVKVTDSVGSVTSQTATLGLSGVNSGIWKGLVAYYPFNTNVNDTSIFGNTGTSNNSTSTSDRFGQNDRAWAFAGDVNSKISIPKKAGQLEFNNEITVSLWVKFNEQWGYHVESIIWNRPAYQSYGFDVGVNQDSSAYGIGKYNYYGAIFQTNSGYAQISGPAVEFASINRWNLLTLTYASGLVKSYVNGVYIATGSSSGNFVRACY